MFKFIFDDTPFIARNIRCAYWKILYDIYVHDFGLYEREAFLASRYMVLYHYDLLEKVLIPTNEEDDWHVFMRTDDEEMFRLFYIVLKYQGLKHVLGFEDIID